MHSIDFGRFVNDKVEEEGKALVKLIDSDEKGFPYQLCRQEGPSTSTPINIENLLEDNWKWSRRLSKNQSPNDAHFLGKSVVFHPHYAWGSIAARADKRLTRNTIAYWEIHVPNVYGTSMMFGIGTKNAKIIAPISFEHLLGGTDGQSWGLAHDGKTRYNGKEEQFCPPFGDHKSSRIGILFNGIQRSLSFSINGGPLRVAFTDLNLNRVLYPMVSSTAQRSKFMLVNERCQSIPKTLTNCCMESIISEVKTIKSIEFLPLPPQLRNELAIRLALRNRRKVRQQKRIESNVGKILKKITVV